MLQTAILGSLLSLLSISYAAPFYHRRQAPLDPSVTPFYLVTTTSSSPSDNSSTLADVSATSFYDAEYANNYTIRQQPAGYNYIPTFTLTDGNLHSLTYAPYGTSKAVFNSTVTAANSTLIFAPAPQPQGCLSLVGAGGEGEGGYLLAKDGETTGWTICPYGEDQEPTLLWKGLDPECEAVYVQAAVDPPY